MRSALLGSLISFLSTGLIHGARSQADEYVSPQWIAVDDPAISRYQFSKQVSFKEPVLSGQMKFASDFARASVTVNGIKVLEVEPYCPLQTLDVTQWLIAGTNRIEIDVERVPGPSAVALDLELRLSSDRSTRCSRNPARCISDESSSKGTIAPKS